MQPANILLVEDNEGDILLTLEAFNEANLNNSILVFRDGDEAIKYLADAGKGNQSLPDLILLDINLPKVDGKEVLRFIKSHTVLKIIPVIILSTSSSTKDVKEAYRLKANSYITKPADLEVFMSSIQSVSKFWFSVATLPQTEAKHLL